MDTQKTKTTLHSYELFQKDALSRCNALKKEHIWSVEDFVIQRPILMPFVMLLKNQRRLNLGSFMSCLFENRFLLWWQIQEMLRIEQGGHEQIQDELDTYNVMIPAPGHGTLTWTLEFPDPEHRAKMLIALHTIVHHLVFQTEDQESFALTECPYYKAVSDAGNALAEKTGIPIEKKAKSLYFMDWDFAASVHVPVQPIALTNVEHEGALTEIAAWQALAKAPEEMKKKIDHYCDLTVFHTIFKEALNLCPDLIRSLPPGFLACTHPQMSVKSQIPLSLWQQLKVEIYGNFDWIRHFACPIT